MQYNPFAVKKRYEQVADIEDKAEKGGSFRVLIPRHFIKKHITLDDIVLDAAGGTGINAIYMALSSKSVTLVDLTPGILNRAKTNIDFRLSHLVHCICNVDVVWLRQKNKVKI